MFSILAPAKINWSLKVLNQRPDGYHNIISLLQCIELFDELKFELSNNIELISNLDIPIEQNLVYKAALVFKEYYKVDEGAKIWLHKSIPTGAGLGGGSSDAAHTLIGLNRLWKLKLDNDKLMKIGQKIGSDVPFFFNCPLAKVKGRGEIVTPLNIETSYTLLLVKPLINIPTSWAYRTLKQLRTNKSQFLDNKENTTELKEKVDTLLIYKALIQRDFTLLRELLNNDFESLIINHFPIIGEIKNELLNSGAHIAMLTGSGSTVFGVFNNRHDALIASKIFKSYWHAVVDTIVSI